MALNGPIEIAGEENARPLIQVPAPALYRVLVVVADEKHWSGIEIDELAIYEYDDALREAYRLIQDELASRK